MELTKEQADESIETIENKITFCNESIEYLKFDNKGNATWTIYNDDDSIKKVIEITDKKLLMLAFMDLVINMSNVEYDYNLLDKELYKEYQEFLDSGKENSGC